MNGSEDSSPLVYQDSGFVFLGPQTGEIERSLVVLLVDLFARQPEVQRAYLVRAASAEQTEPRVVLCLLCEHEDRRALVQAIGEAFRKLFGGHSFLDIVFLGSGADETRLRQACPPFYDRAS